jgi:hypothetical protein
LNTREDKERVSGAEKRRKIFFFSLFYIETANQIHTTKINSIGNTIYYLMMILQSSSSSRRISWSPILLFSVVLLWVGGQQTGTAFVPTTTEIRSRPQIQVLQQQQQLIVNNNKYNQRQQQLTNVVGRNKKNNMRSNTQLYFMGSDGGILGIGTPEVVSKPFQYCFCFYCSSS